MARKLKMTTYVDLAGSGFVKMWTDVHGDDLADDFGVFAEKADGSIVILAISNSWEIAEEMLHRKARIAGLANQNSPKSGVGYYTNEPYRVTSRVDYL